MVAFHRSRGRRDQHARKNNSALLIEKVPGFKEVAIGELILLWNSRPRLAWMVLFRSPHETDREIHKYLRLSCCFAILAEIICQAIGAVYMG